MRWNHEWRTVGLMGVLALALAGETASARQIPPPNPVDEYDASGAQALTQGPLHEAFAEPVVFDPGPGLIIPRTPPQPVTELPPDQQPDGDNITWIPGYWAWDDSREDFVWVSGLWRAVPPGREWVPGYWAEAQGGFRWVPGYWDAIDAQEDVYYSQPPASLEAGPNGPPPTETCTWTPGIWIWQQSAYVWRPGYWVAPQPNWIWMPDRYCYTPYGYVYNQGYWDYPAETRGTLFAPVYFPEPIYVQPSYAYTPSVSLVTTSLFLNLFIQPANCHYYFGDYYGGQYLRNGYQPWHTFNHGRRGYDPLYAHAYAQNRRTNPQWANRIRQDYDHRLGHPEARPPRTFAEQRRLAARPGNGAWLGQGRQANHHEIARPLKQVANGPRPGGSAPGFRTLDAARRQQIAQNAARVRKASEARRRRETQIAQADRPQSPNRQTPQQPRRVARPNTPGAASRPAAVANAGRPAGSSRPNQANAAGRPAGGNATRPANRPNVQPRPNQPNASRPSATANARPNQGNATGRPQSQPRPRPNQPAASRPGAAANPGRPVPTSRRTPPNAAGRPAGGNAARPANRPNLQPRPNQPNASRPSATANPRPNQINTTRGNAARPVNRPQAQPRPRPNQPNAARPGAAANPGRPVPTSRRTPPNAAGRPAGGNAARPASRPQTQPRPQPRQNQPAASRPAARPQPQPRPNQPAAARPAARREARQPNPAAARAQRPNRPNPTPQPSSRRPQPTTNRANAAPERRGSASPDQPRPKARANGKPSGSPRSRPR